MTPCAPASTTWACPCWKACRVHNRYRCPHIGRHVRTAVILVVIGASLAGCLADGTPDDQTTDAAERPMLPFDPMQSDAGHDHGDPSLHQHLWNYEFTSRDPLLQDEFNNAGVHALSVAQDHLFGAVYGSHTVDIRGGIVIWDISEPTMPVMVGRHYIPGAVGGDRGIDVTPDGAFTVLAAEQVTCFGQVNPVPVNVYVFDTSDKSNPVITDVRSAAGNTAGTPDRVAPSTGTHSVSVHRIGGDDYAFLFGDVFRISEEGRLIDTGARVPVGHDLYVRDTPWGDVWGLSANGGRQFQIFDLTEPEAPRELAFFEGGEGYYLHTADVGFFDDQVLVALSSEDWGDSVSTIWLMDATSLRDDPRDDPIVLEELSTWTNPGNHPAGGLSFSLHNPRWNEDGIFTMSSYHGGLWQLDFRHPEFRADPAEIAFAVYSEGTPPIAEDPVHDTVESNLCGLGIGLDTPSYMDVELGPGGVLYAADVYMGLYTFAPTADHPVYGDADAPTAETSS